MNGIFGNGSDGDVTISSDTTLSTDKCYNNLTINNGITLTTAGFRIRVKGTLLNNGTINSDYIGTGGVGGTGGTGGTIPSNPGQAGSSSATEGNGAGGGGGGAGGNSNDGFGTLRESGGNGGNGGTGGRKSKNIFICAYTLNNLGIISSSGENGSNGTNGVENHHSEFGYTWCGGGGGGGGGGTGGDGGNLDLFYYSLSNLGTINYLGGTGGTGGSSAGVDSVNPLIITNGGIGGNGINGFRGSGGSASIVGGDGNSRGGGAGGGAGFAYSSGGSGTSYGGNGANGGNGKNGIYNITNISDYTSSWISIINDYNFSNILNNTYSRAESRCLELEYFGSGDCEIYKIIDFNTDIAGLIYNFSGAVKVLSLSTGATVNFKYEWLNESQGVISSHSLASLTSTQDYTNAYSLNQTAPSNAQMIKIRFFISGNAAARAFLENVNITETYSYGAKIKDGVNLNIIKPETITILSSGTVTMPNSLNGDNTYGYDIDLPGTEAIPTSKIGVIILPHSNLTWECYGKWLGWASGDPTSTMKYIPSMYLDDDYTYYTKDDTTGVMTTFTPGNHTASTPSTWDAIISIFPIVGWDRVDTNITSVRLWAATAYIIADGLSTFKTVYSIGNTGGITSVDYTIFLKEYNY